MLGATVADVMSPEPLTIAPDIPDMTPKSPP